MFEQEQQTLETRIKDFCAAQGIPMAEVKWLPIPFSGEWGISTSFFASAAAEAKAGRSKGKPVPQRAQAMAEAVKKTHEAMPQPALVIAIGDDACGTGILNGSYAVLGGVEKILPVDLKIPGNPPAPIDIMRALVALMATLKNGVKP